MQINPVVYLKIHIKVFDFVHYRSLVCRVYERISQSVRLTSLYLATHLLFWFLFHNHTALRMAKSKQSFGHSECYSVKFDYILENSMATKLVQSHILKVWIKVKQDKEYVLFII